MKIGILSDTHDHLVATREALAILSHCDVILHCGDLCAPFMVDELEAVGKPVHCVFGNTDDRYATTLKCMAAKNVTLHGDTCELELDGKKILMNHYPDIAHAFAFSEKYDLVLHGHTHKQREEKIGKTLLVNPGEVMGRLGKRSVAVYEDGKVEFFEF